jgi:FG-GAP-like repeat/FG-GAP repeat
VGDFNGDSKADLVVANSQDDTVSVLLGKGDGTFQSAVNDGAGAFPASVAVADLNGDGKLDLLVADAGGNPDYVSVLVGYGNGTFQTAVNCRVGVSNLLAVAADLNGDGKPDVVVASTGSGKVSILLNSTIY